MIYRERPGDDAVSAVVGVILMVALTVVLAAILAQFVFDLANMLQAPIQAGVTVQETPCTSTATYTCSSGDTYNVSVVLSDKVNADIIEVRSPTAYNPTNMTRVGDSRQIPDVPKGQTITVVGHRDGRASVIQTYEAGQGS